MWWHSAATSERGFWIILEKMKTLWGYNWARLDLCEVNDWLVKKMCEDNLRLHLSEVLIIKTRRHSENTTRQDFWLVSEKNVWRHSEATKKRKFWLVSGKNLMTFCDYNWARFLNNSQKNEDIVRLQMSEATSLRGLWLVSEKTMWRHSATISEWGF